MDPEAAGYIVGMLVGALIGLAIGVLISAVLIRGAVSLHNLTAGGSEAPKGVPMPSFGRAILLALIAAVVNVVVSFVVGIVVGIIGAMTGAEETAIVLSAQLTAVPLSLAAMGLVFRFGIPTTFGRAGLVLLWYIGILVAIVVIVSVAIFAVMSLIG